MKNETEKTEDIKEIKDLFRFHGITLPIVEHNGQDFIPIKPLIDLVGLAWRTTKRRLQKPTKQEFHAFCQLKIANLDGLEGLKASENYCITLESVQYFLVQINLDRLESNDKPDVAEYLKKLHKEWMSALHSYETNGVAIKSEQKSHLKDLFSLRKSAIGEEKEQLTRLIRVELAKFSDIDVADLIDPQQNLPI